MELSILNKEIGQDRGDVSDWEIKFDSRSHSRHRDLTQIFILSYPGVVFANLYNSHNTNKFVINDLFCPLILMLITQFKYLFPLIILNRLSSKNAYIKVFYFVFEIKSMFWSCSARSPGIFFCPNDPNNSNILIFLFEQKFRSRIFLWFNYYQRHTRWNGWWFIIDEGFNFRGFLVFELTGIISLILSWKISSLTSRGTDEFS